MAKYTYAKGRRKEAVATIRLYKGKGESTINEKKIEEIYHMPHQLDRLMSPLDLVNAKDDYYFTAKTIGGGFTGQLDAIVLAMSRALIEENPEYKSILKKNDLLTRDPRMVERKKTGLRKARKQAQFSKR
jgi:small subunit ribosomal protein S9